MFLEHWSSLEITELQAFQVLINQDDEEEVDPDDDPEDEESAAEPEETKGQRELTPAEILAILDADTADQKKTNGRT